MKKTAVSLPANYTEDDPLDLAGKQPLFEAMDTQWWTLPHDQQKQAIVNAFRATMLSPRMNLKSNAILYQSIMHIPADESDPDVFENTIRELKKRWDAQGQMGLEQQPEDVMAVDEILPGKFLPGFWGNLRRLANLGPYAEELTRLANEDIMNGGTGQIFRAGVLGLAIPGVGPKVSSFAWLALAPTTSELATIDVHMMRYLGEGDDSPKSDAEYLKLEDRLRQERDQVYPDVPLTQYQWGVWDKQRTPGFHQDHTPLRAYDPVPYRDVNWETPVRPPRPKQLVQYAPGQLSFGKTAMIVEEIAVPRQRDWSNDLPFVYIPNEDKVYVSTVPCSHPDLMYQIFEESFEREDLFEWQGLVAGEFQPIGNRWQAAILYTDLDETNVDEIQAWANEYKKTLPPYKRPEPGQKGIYAHVKEAIMPGHIGSWIYFTDTGEFYLGLTHMTIFSRFGYDTGTQAIKNYANRPMIVGQVNDDGDIEGVTDWTDLSNVSTTGQVPAIVRENIATILNTFTDDGYTTKLEALAHELQLARVYRVQDGQVKKAKTSGNLTNGFVYHNGKLVVENRPHPLIIRDHFPGIMADKNFEFQDVQAGLIFEENGKVYPVFHSYTAPSQEHKREALAALENYYHRPIGEELDYDEAMNRLSHVSRVEIVDHPYDDRWGLNGWGVWAMIYDPSDQVVYVGQEGSSHGALMTKVPKLHDELTNYDNDIFGRGNIGYYHYYSNPSIPGHNVYHLTGGQMSPELEEEVKQTMRRVRTSAVDPENNPDIAGFRSWIYMDGYLYMAKQNAENHQDLADKYDIRPEDWVTKPFVVGVIWPQENNFGVVTAADINLYSDYLDELSQDSYDEDSDEYENLNERNRKEGQILVRALTAVYEWWSDNFPAIPLTVNGVSIEEYLPFSDVTSNNAKIAMTTTYVPASSDPWHSGDGISYAYDIANDALYWTDGHHPDIYEHVVQEIKHDYSYPPLDNFIWGFHSLHDSVNEFYEFQGSGNVRFDKVRLPDEKVAEIQGKLNEIINSGYQVTSASELPKVQWVSYDYDPDVDDEGPDIHGGGLPFTYFPQADTIVIADEEVFHMDMFDWMARAGLNIRGPSFTEYLMGGDMIPGRVDANGDVGFYNDPGENKERISEALREQWPVISSYLTYSDEYGGLWRPGESAETWMRYNQDEDPNYIVNIAKVSKTKIIKVDTPTDTHGKGSGYPFFYRRATDTLYIAKGECMHMELIAAAGIELTESDYLYGAGGDAGYQAGFLSGRVGSTYEEDFFLFEGDESMLSPEARDYLHQVSQTKKVAVAAAGVAEEDDRISAKVTKIIELNKDQALEDSWRGILFVYDAKTDNLYLDHAAEYHINILSQIVENLESDDPDDRFDFNSEFVFGAIRNSGTIEFFGDTAEQLPNQARAKQLIEEWQTQRHTAARPELVWMPCDNMHSLGLPILYINGTAYIGELEGYHINLFEEILHAGYVSDIPSHVLAARIDRRGDVAKYDFDTNDETEDIADLTGQDDELITILTNHWPEIAENLKGLNGEEGSLLTESGWPKLINVKQLYEDHQAHLQADPSIQGFAAVEDITVRDIDTGQEHVGYDDRQPFIYYPPAKTVFIGNVGSWHANVAMTVAEQFGYERDSLYQSPQGIIRKGRVDGWYNRPEAGDELSTDIEQAIAQAFGGLRLTKKAEADMQGAMFGLRVPINIANAFKMTAGEGTDLNWIDVGDARHHGVGLPLMAAYGLQEIWIARQPTYHSDMMEHMPNVSRFIDGAGRVYLDEDGDVAVTLYGEADQLVKEIIGAHLEEVRMALKALPNREDSVTLNTLGGDIAKIGAMPARKAEADMNGAMFGLAVPMQIAKELAIPGGEPPDLMHITLAYFKDAAADRDDWDQAVQIGKQFNFNLSGEIAGYGTFDNDEVVLWAQPEVPGLAEEREKLVAALNKAGFPVDDRFPDFKPHITLAYDWQGDVPELEQPIPVQFDGLYFYRGENIQKVAAGLEAFHVAPQSARRSIQSKGMPAGTYFFMEEDQADEWWDDQHNGLDEPSDIYAVDLSGVELEENEGWYGTYTNVTPITPDRITFIGEPRVKTSAADKTAMNIERLGPEVNTEHPSDRVGFEKGARAFAYDPTTDTIYTHTGHHPDIVHELYGGERYTPEYEESFKRAAEDYLWGWANGPTHQNGSKIGAWSGNVRGKPIPDDTLVKIWQTIWNSDEIPQIQDTWGWSAPGRDPVLSKLIAPHIDEVYPLTSQNFIFLYNPEEDMLYIGASQKFHIDLINYVLGVKKHTNPDDSYTFLDKYVLGIWYGDDPEYHTTVSPENDARVRELGAEVSQVMGGY